MKSRVLDRFWPGILILALAGCAGPMADSGPDRTVTVGILAINDFHGHLAAPGSSNSPSPSFAPAGSPGGAARLASAMDSLRQKYRHHITVSAGDLIGASPLASSMFLDEPTIGVMNRIGLDFNAAGNHEFDRGRAELLRMQRGGCERHTNREPCRIERFAGADFRFLAANTITESGETLFPAVGIRELGTGPDRVAIGIIGLTLADTPSLVPPDGVAGLRFGDEAEAANRAIPALHEAGVDAIVVLIHQGGTRPDKAGDPDGCDGLEGAILPIIEKLDPVVDIVVSGHTHQAYVCHVPRGAGRPPLLLTSAGFYGGMVTDIALTIDPATGRVTGRSARNVIVDPAAFAPRSDIAAYVARYIEAANAVAGRRVGRLTASAQRQEDRTGGPLGNLITDAQLFATRQAGAQIALTNPFGIRASLNPASDGTVTFAQLYAAQPFNNPLVTMTLSGAQLKAVLEQGLDDDGARQVLALSSPAKMEYDLSLPSGERVTALTIDGVAVERSAPYRVTVNGFLAAGGDGFTGFAKGADRVTGPTDIEALEMWFSAVPKRTLPTEDRSVRRTGDHAAP